MASKEWMIAKVSISILSIITIVSICIGGANIVVNLQNDMLDVEDDVEKLEGRVVSHIEDEDETFDKIDDEIDSLKEKNHALELAMSEQTVRFNYIVDELRELNEKIDQFEVVQ